MRRIRSRFTAAAALCLTVALLTGCSLGGKTTVENSPKPSDQPVDLVLYSWYGQRREGLDEAIDAYEAKHQNVNIKVRELQPGQVMTHDGKVNSSLFEDGDLILLPFTQAVSLYKEGKLRDVSNVRLPELNEGIAHLFEDLSKVDGKRIALPYSFNATMLLMNQGALERAGVKVPPVDWTVEEWDQIHTALKSAGVQSNLPLQMMLDPMVRAFGGALYDPATQTWTLDTPEVKQGLAWVATQVQNQVLQGGTGPVRIMIGGGPNAPAFTPMVAGVSATFPGSTMMPVPKGPRGRSTQASAMVGAVLATSANPEQATDFLKELISNPEIQIALAKSGIRPVIDDSKALAAWQESVGDRSAQALELSLQGAYTATGGSLSDLISGLDPFFQGKASLEELIPGLTAQLNAGGGN